MNEETGNLVFILAVGLGIMSVAAMVLSDFRIGLLVGVAYSFGAVISYFAYKGVMENEN